MWHLGSHGTWIGSAALPPQSTVVESWTGPAYLNTARMHGYDGILAYGWYLDRQNPVDGERSWAFMDTWAQMYAVDPEVPASADDKLNALLEQQRRDMESSRRAGVAVGRALGGEASIWTEQVGGILCYENCCSLNFLCSCIFILDTNIIQISYKYHRNIIEISCIQIITMILI
jgi:hypothetical protein